MTMATPRRRRKIVEEPAKKTAMEQQVAADERYKEKQKSGHKIQVMVWVPEDKREQLLKYAAKLRKQAAA
jgi:hypothetical protein